MKKNFDHPRSLKLWVESELRVARKAVLLPIVNASGSSLIEAKNREVAGLWLIAYHYPGLLPFGKFVEDSQ